MKENFKLLGLHGRLEQSISKKLPTLASDFIGPSRRRASK